MISALRMVIIDYGTGNLHSVKRAVDRVAGSSLVSSRAADVEQADKIILPGVGHFGTTMTNLAQAGLVEPLNEAVKVRQKPVLGICLGMELMARRGDEGDVDGLGWLDVVSVKFSHNDKQRYKVPHIGWNTVSVANGSQLMEGIAEDSEFYFAHSYILKVGEGCRPAGETEYEVTFPSVIERDNVFGVQFHPEKSHDAGRRVLENFARI